MEPRAAATKNVFIMQRPDIALKFDDAITHDKCGDSGFNRTVREGITKEMYLFCDDSRTWRWAVKVYESTDARSFRDKFINPKSYKIVGQDKTKKIKGCKEPWDYAVYVYRLANGGTFINIDFQKLTSQHIGVEITYFEHLLGDNRNMIHQGQLTRSQEDFVTEFIERAVSSFEITRGLR